ncbi:MAG: nucleotidyl transferase AbiEii/AbiGii toxin family protein [Nitrospinae bacterium]|nr:nucleotidyl transferase AbiEii/AbiGii toxin family protein [Nitrospinota bacterium]
MPEPNYKIDVAKWVENAKADPVAYRQRQTVEIVLNAIAITTPLNAKMFLKGGILMGLAYDSPRQTTDIDMTTKLIVKHNTGDMIRTKLDAAFPRAAAALGYADLVLITHSLKRMPRKTKFENADFPALKLKIAYARRGTKQETRLSEGKVSEMIDLDISFNETLQHIQVLELTGGQKLRAYGLVDLIAEKFRAMLQQVPRRRNRRQDVYDLDLLIGKHEIDDALRAQILDVFIEKCRSRRIEPTDLSLNDPEIKTRSHAEWQTMELELSEVPEFECCFARVSEFYRNLPWQSE